MIKHVKTLAMASALTALGVVAHAQQAPAPTPAPAPRPATAPATQGPLTPLKLQVVIARYQGEKKVSSMPYTLALLAADRPMYRGSVQSAIQVLIPMVTVAEKTTGPVYKDVGTKIDCSATTIEGGRFKVEINLEDAGVYPDAKLPADGMKGPWLTAFRSTQTVLLKDGQTVEYSTGTDRATGEIVKLEVTLTVVK